MINKYIQQKRDSKELNELLKHEHNCFILLTQIAQRAKRTKDFSSEDLDINQALIGDYKTIGLTEQKYRTAKNKLKKWQFVTFKTTNKGTIATLLDTSIYNINAENNNEQDNSQVTNKQRTGNEQVTTNKNVKKEKNDNNEKNLKEIYKEKFNELWNKYPNKDGAKFAKKYFNASVKTKKDWQDINTALENYLQSERVKNGYIKNGSTWFYNWKDWIDYVEPNKPSGIKKSLTPTERTVMAEIKRNKK